jgi:glycosyltransferase involved in cell wall biosynthesis
MKKNILLVGHSGDMYGASRSLIKLVKILEQNYTVHVILPEIGALFDNLTAIIPSQRILINEDLYIFTRKSFKIKYLISTLFRFLRNVISLIKIIQKFKIEIVHTNSGVVPAPALAAKLSGKKHIWHIREWFGDFKQFWPLYSGYITGLSDQVVCVSKTMAEQFKNSKNILAIYNGFEIPKVQTKATITDDLQNKLNNADLILGCTSRIRLIRKGQEYLIEAIGILTKKTGKNIQAVLIGDYVPGYESQKEYMHNLISKYDLEDQIHFLGHLKDPLPYYRLFDVFVLPSGEPEPFGGVIMEAMSMGLPVIGSNAGGTTEQIADGWNGYLFENQNADDLAQKLALFLDEKDKLNLFGSRSIKRIEENFSLEIHEGKVLRLYDELIGF